MLLVHEMLLFEFIYEMIMLMLMLIILYMLLCSVRYMLYQWYCPYIFVKC
jgi:hypothetical protein